MNTTPKRCGSTYPGVATGRRGRPIRCEGMAGHPGEHGHSFYARYWENEMDTATKCDQTAADGCAEHPELGKCVACGYVIHDIPLGTDTAHDDLCCGTAECTMSPIEVCVTHDHPGRPIEVRPAPAAPSIPGPQGCGLCGATRPNRGAMLAHYEAFHHVVVSA
jgi:hypothetical protein